MTFEETESQLLGAFMETWAQVPQNNPAAQSLLNSTQGLSQWNIVGCLYFYRELLRAHAEEVAQLKVELQLLKNPPSTKHLFPGTRVH